MSSVVSEKTSSERRPASAVPEEVVTHAHLRLIAVPDVAGTVAVITLDNGLDHTRPSTFGPQGIASLNAALDGAFAAQPSAVVVTGKPFVFAVGADLSQIATITDRETARQTGILGHSTFKRLRDSTVPTFAFVNGASIGGGVELALACHYRTMAANAPMMALSECFLGILPGWGGTQFLPRIVGPENAVTVIVDNALNQNHMMRPKEALSLGVVDVVLDAADYLEQSFNWMADVLAGRVVVPRKDYSRPEFDAEWTSALERGRMIADLRTHGAAPAPYRALELIALSRTTDLATGLAAEAEGLADLVVSQEFRAGLYSFNLTQKRARKPAGAPDPSLARAVTKVGVIGAGLMAGQIALLFAQRLHVPVVLTDVDQARLDKGVAGVHRKIADRAAQRKMTPDEANRLTALVTGSLDYQAFSDADFVIEAVFEELGAKKEVFARLEQVIPADAVLATNTSSLSITAMSADLQHPERVIGFHFFNPISVMPLLEIVRTAATSDGTAATALSVAKTLKKGPIFTSDSPAFVVNRLLTRFMGEIIAAIDEGTDPAVADAALAPLGLPMTPIMLLQLVGPAVALHVTETLHEAFPDRFTVSENLRRIVDAGARTLVSWTETGQQILDPDIAALWQQGSSPSTGEQVRDRALAALAQEARLMLDGKVVAAAADVDLALLTGAGWPFWLGGITPYLDREGVSDKVTGRRFNPPGVSTLP
ncbi:3-hydroxyacyl-CoA dehydrogenase [Nakamurella panacisegetis]|uniref:3-hydroxyacyl-CoA dehydrogenase n=1 Tax=Nakamurella panacisegetis TaxID=1090615 RepID=A0A1H0QJD6_9ACTN|nr:3-hydroxyacyl-CoA dehydrogenase NAD-binding domain-containing protein [Nakamurella panacisegetis]SDP17175.1 3-hydroxyacyl-CoA dehydrogenase [Nakamurella panacisegetis]